MSIDKKSKRFKKFGSAKEPIQFEIGGETFTSVPELDYRKVNELFFVENDEGEREAVTILNSLEDALDKIKQTLVDDDERERFDALIDNPDVIIPLKVINELFSWLFTEYEVIDPKAAPQAV